MMIFTIEATRTTSSVKIFSAKGRRLNDDLTNWATTTISADVDITGQGQKIDSIVFTYECKI